MFKPILISLSPNASGRDALLAAQALPTPWRFKTGPKLALLKQVLTDYFGGTHAFLVNAGRTGLYLTLAALDLKAKDEVLLQAFTCVAVPNAILSAGGKPVYVDTVQNGFNLSVNDLQKKINRKTRALIIQHTFGVPDDLKEIVKICRQKGIILIEDCAHSLGAEYQGKKVGSFGDAAVLSFGRDKVISAVFGGAVVTKNQLLAKKINLSYRQLNYPGFGFIFKQLLHPLLFALVVPVYYFPHHRFSLGKLVVALARGLNLITLPVSRKDKQGQSDLPLNKLPEALAGLVYDQWLRLPEFNRNRKKIALAYRRGLKPLSRNYPLEVPTVKPGAIYLRYPLLTRDPERMRAALSQKGVLLGNWYRPVISPLGVNLTAIGYQPASCPHAEAVAHTVVNLPTHPRLGLADARKVIKLIKDYVHHQAD